MNIKKEAWNEILASFDFCFFDIIWQEPLLPELPEFQQQRERGQEPESLL